MKTSKTDEVNETYRFPTRQNPGNEKEHTPIQTRILNELRELEQLEQLSPLEDTDSLDHFLSNFDWSVSTLQPDAKQAVENLFVEFPRHFCTALFRHRNQYKVQSATHTVRQQACL